jgi:hypothetical protein
VIDGATNTITDTVDRGGMAAAANPATSAVYEAAYYQVRGAWVITPAATNSWSPIITTVSIPIFSTGQAGSATIQASALPAATFTETGALPDGLTWNSDGTISGTPAAGTGGVYPITIIASNGIGPDSTKSLDVAVEQPTVITSPASATFRVGEYSVFTLKSSGYPEPTYQVAAQAPYFLALWRLPSGDWAIGGTPNPGSGGRYQFMIEASNGIGTADTQLFTLTVLEAPSFTSRARAVFRAGHSAAFTVSAHGYPAPSFTATGTVPSWVKLAAGGVLRAARRRTPAGAYHFTISARNGIGSAASQAFTLDVDQPPAIISPRRATFRAGHRSTFRFRSTGFPAAKLSERGHLPSGVRFVRERNGTAILTGKAARGAKGRTYKITITASNGVGPAVHQTFWLKVS